MAEKTIRVAVWEYLNAEGKRRFAYFGDTVEVPESEIAKGELVAAFGAEAIEPGKNADTEAPAESAGKLDRPKNAAPKPAWEAYAASRGVEGVDDMSKDELVAAVNALDAQ